VLGPFSGPLCGPFRIKFKLFCTLKANHHQRNRIDAS
jgi:hypothetical protein